MFVSPFVIISDKVTSEDFIFSKVMFHGSGVVTATIFSPLAPVN